MAAGQCGKQNGEVNFGTLIGMVAKEPFVGDRYVARISLLVVHLVLN